MLRPEHSGERLTSEHVVPAGESLRAIDFESAGSF